MSFISEIDAVLQLEFEQFKAFILQKRQLNEDYPEQFFWVPNGLQLTVLNYLIQQHQENRSGSIAPIDYTQHIDFVINCMRDKNTGEPIHQAILLEKIQLAIHLLSQNIFDMNKRDKEGNTLLSLIIAAKKKELLKIALDKKPNIHETTLFTTDRIPYQPLHAAIMQDFASGVQMLAETGAQLDNPVGPLMDTPVLLAARLGRIKILKVLLKFPVEKLNLEAENNNSCEEEGHGFNAMEELCKLLTDDKKNKHLIKGIAMLLCVGAEPPRREEMRQLLANKRAELLREIDVYLESRPSLVDTFVARCHLSENPLHAIIYVDHSWGKALRHLFGRPSAAAFTVESWITRKYSRPLEASSESIELPGKAATVLTGSESPLKLYADFVRRYEMAYGSQRITNPWSTMRWMIADGQCTWDTVLKYSKEHPASRTRIIINDMLPLTSKSEGQKEHASPAGQPLTLQ